MKMSRILKITLNINFFKKGSFTFCGNWMGAEAGVFCICEYLRVLDPRMETVMRFVCAGILIRIVFLLNSKETVIDTLMNRRELCHFSC